MHLAHQYSLSRSLDPQHGSDVKAVISVGDDRIASASRDSSVAVWRLDESAEYTLEALLNGHHAYVNSLAYILSNGNHNQDLLASGGNSSLIFLHDLANLNSDPVDCLIGHSLNVCTLSYSPSSGYLISGSWDHTARVWRCVGGKWDVELVLDGHSEAVWGVTVVDQGPRKGCFLTGSADRLINLWNETGELVSRFKGSPEPVRSLALLPGGDTFVSACNDGLIRKWDFTGSVMEILRGHTDYVYDVVSDGERIISCGEDHSVRVWEGGKTTAVLLHPCQTVWSVAALRNGDIVTGGSDGKVRIWSTHKSRIASTDALREYEKEVETAMSEYRPSKKGVTDIEAPANEAIIIDIDISDDEPPIPLSYNVGEHPRQVAEAFGKEHKMSDNYINQIEAFIKAQVGWVDEEAIADDK